LGNCGNGQRLGGSGLAKQQDRASGSLIWMAMLASSSRLGRWTQLVDAAVGRWVLRDLLVAGKKNESLGTALALQNAIVEGKVAKDRWGKKREFPEYSALQRAECVTPEFF
jgi:hypothetical protein